ncbi:MAG: universal stress protein, partial [Dehalococcoidia bacterium]
MGVSRMCFQKILVPLDGSPAAEGIIPYADQLARDFNASVTLFHVIGHRSRSQPTEEIFFAKDFRDTLKTLAGSYLVRIKERLRLGGLSVDTAMASGSVAKQIVSFAEKNRYDLITMSTRGHSGVKRWVYGSIASKVLHSTHLPLFVVKPTTAEAVPQPGRPFRKILVPLDGSQLAETVLPTVRALGAREGYQITLLRVVSPITVAAAMGGVGAGVALPAQYVTGVKEISKHQEDLAADYLKGVMWELMALDLAAEAKMAKGDPAEQIIAAGNEPEPPLIVIATHGR